MCGQIDEPPHSCSCGGGASKKTKAARKREQNIRKREGERMGGWAVEKEEERKATSGDNREGERGDESGEGR